MDLRRLDIAKYGAILTVLLAVECQIWAAPTVTDRLRTCWSAFAGSASIPKISSVEYKRLLGEGFEGYLGQRFDFSKIRFGTFLPSTRPQTIRSLSQLDADDQALINKILERSISRRPIQGAIANGSIKEYVQKLPTVEHEKSVVEYGAFQFHLKDHRKITGFVSSSDKFQILGNDLAKTLNGLVRAKRFSASDIEKIRYFHLHPEPLPLSEADDRMAMSILANTPHVKLELGAISKIETQVVIFSSDY